MQLMLYILIELFFILACYFDCRQGRIPNVLTFPTILLGCFSFIVTKGAFFETIFSIFLILLLGYLGLVGGMGDAKMFIALSFFLGLHTWTVIFIACLLFISKHVVFQREETVRSFQNVRNAFRFQDINFLKPKGKKESFAPYMLIAYQGFLFFEIWKGGFCFG